jgi:hypothetical protein
MSRVLVTLSLLAACSGSDAPAGENEELEAHRAWLAACDGQTANYQACRTYCAEKAAPADRTDCFFQLAEHAPRWADGNAALALQIAYEVCNSSQDFGAQCFRHSLHEIGITCNALGQAWMDDPTWQAGDRWAPWQACVAHRVLARQNATCLMPIRQSYHNMWIADDAPLCGQ